MSEATKFVNQSRRMWTEDECHTMLKAALLKLIDDAGGKITIQVTDLYKASHSLKGILAMSLSDDDKVLTLTRMKQQ